LGSLFWDIILNQYTKEWLERQWSKVDYHGKANGPTSIILTLTFSMVTLY